MDTFSPGARYDQYEPYVQHDLTVSIPEPENLLGTIQEDLACVSSSDLTSFFNPIHGWNNIANPPAESEFALFDATDHDEAGSLSTWSRKRACPDAPHYRGFPFIRPTYPLPPALPPALPIPSRRPPAVAPRPLPVPPLPPGPPAFSFNLPPSPPAHLPSPPPLPSSSKLNDIGDSPKLTAACELTSKLNAVCEVCGTRFTRPKDRARHERTSARHRHRLAKVMASKGMDSEEIEKILKLLYKYRCSLCGKKFARVDSLRRHLKNSHCCAPGLDPTPTASTSASSASPPQRKEEKDIPT